MSSIGHMYAATAPAKVVDRLVLGYGDAPTATGVALVRGGAASDARGSVSWTTSSTSSTRGRNKRGKSLAQLCPQRQREFFEQIDRRARASRWLRASSRPVKLPAPTSNLFLSTCVRAATYSLTCRAAGVRATAILRAQSCAHCNGAALRLVILADLCAPGEMRDRLKSIADQAGSPRIPSRKRKNHLGAGHGKAWSSVAKNNGTTASLGTQLVPAPPEAGDDRRPGGGAVDAATGAINPRQSRGDHSSCGMRTTSNGRGYC